MNRKVWTGILAGLLAALVVVGVAGAAFKAGEGHEDDEGRKGRGGEAVRVVGGNGEVVVLGGEDGDGGPEGGFFLLPLLVGGALVFLLARSLGNGGRHHGWGPGPDSSFEELHRRAHERAGSGPGASEPAGP